MAPKNMREEMTTDGKGNFVKEKTLSLNVVREHLQKKEGPPHCSCVTSFC